MADAITIQELIDARTDAKTLEEAVNGDAVTTVLSRLGETYPTLSNALNQIDSKLDSADTQIKQGITNLFEAGGLPATPFKTKALMTASALANDKYAMVTDDTVNNGLYIKTAGAWVKSSYDPTAVSKTYFDTQSLGKKPIALIAGNTTSDGYGFTNTSMIATTPNLIQTFAGDKLIIKGVADPKLTVAIFTYNENMEFLANSGNYSQSTSDREFIVGDGYIKLNIIYVGGVVYTKELLQSTASIVFLKYNKLRRDYVELTKHNNTLNTDAPLEIGYLEKAVDGYNFTTIGNINSGRLQDVNYSFLSERRTRKPLKVLSGTPISVKYNSGTARLFEYDKAFNVVHHYAVTSEQNYNLGASTAYVKLSFEGVTSLNPKVIITHEWGGSKAEWAYNIRNANRTYNSTNFTYEANTNQGRDIYGADVNTEQYTTERYFNTGIIKLPPNYDPNGEPVRLIVFVQGSGGFLVFSDGSINPSYESEDSSKGVFNYWLNEGYAVLGVYPWTSKFNIPDPTTNGGTPTAMAAYKQAYDWVVNNYNVRQDGVFIASKSSGGFCAVLLPYMASIPILANAVLAPVISPLREPYGPNYNTRIAYATDFGFTGDHSVLQNQSASTPATHRNEALYQYMRENADKIVGYNPFWCGLINADLTELTETGINRTDQQYEINKDKKRIYPVPIKFWAAADDVVGTYEQSRLYVQTIRNTFGNAEMRTMPDGMGGHSSVDTSPLAPKVATITTKLGIAHTDIALAMVEMIQYFRRFG